MADTAGATARMGNLDADDVISILLEQHRRVRELFTQIRSARAEERKQPFDELRALLAVHETAEELVLRPVASGDAWKQVADARNHEEKEANQVLADLERLDTESEAFLAKLETFESAVDEHARAEESEEFPRILESLDDDERHKLGKRVQAVERMAPTHPHPTAAGSTTAQALTGPFAAMVDRVRDTMSR